MFSLTTFMDGGGSNLNPIPVIVVIVPHTPFLLFLQAFLIHLP